MAYESLESQKVRSMSDDEIDALVRKFRDELFVLKNQSVSEKVEDVSRFEKLRADIARLKTEQTARRHAAATA